MTATELSVELCSQLLSADFVVTSNALMLVIGQQKGLLDSTPSVLRI